ncbi:MAG: ATP-binding protein [Actinomycetota bacterium]|nr:ATP-binding protein [Actinomycetota bacterium]
MIELFDELRTCDDVRSLGSRQIGEGLRMDYKEDLRLTKSGRKELAKDVSALANAEGGLLVVGVRDPEREGEPPKPEDFVGMAAKETLARDVASSLLDSAAPPLQPRVRLTEDDFEDARTGERRRFLLIGTAPSPRLHQVTAGGDDRFYVRAGYQNRRMGIEEVRLRLAAEASADERIDRLAEEEFARVGKVFDGGPRVAFVAVPTRPHRPTVEPASDEARRALGMYAGRQPPQHMPSKIPALLSPGYDSSKIFLPAGDGARYLYRSAFPPVTAEVRVRRDGLVSSARNEVELYSEPDERLWLRRPRPSDAVLVEVPEGEREADLAQGAALRAAEGYPSTVADLMPAVRLSPPVLLSAARGFLRFVRETYEHLGYTGPVRVEVRVTGGGSYLAVSADPEDRKPRFYFVSEQTELGASLEAERADLERREVELAKEISTRLAWHFGKEDFPA